MNKKAIILMLFLAFVAQPFVYADSSERTQIYYNNGVTYLKSKKYSSAIVEFKKVLRARPYDKTAQNALAMAYLSRAQYYKDSEKNYKKAICDLKSALTYFKYWNEAPDSSKAPIVQNASVTLQNLTKNYAPLNSAEAILGEAKILRSQGELAASIYTYTLLFENSKYQSEALRATSDIYKSLNNLKMAMENARQAISINPKDGMAHFKYAVILDDIDNEDAAIDEYSKALEYSDNNKELLSALQNLWMAKSVQNPKDSQSLINLGAILQKQNQLELARAQYIKARQINPNDPVALINLASVYTALGDYDSALRVYDDILLNNKGDLSARYYKGQLYEKKGDIASAMAQYKEILALNKNDEKASLALNNLLSNLNGDQLLGYLKNEAELKSQSYDAQFKYAFELHKNKKYEGAIVYYKKAIGLNPKNPEPFINLAQIFLAQNDVERAKNVIAHGLSMLPDNKDLSDLQDIVQKQAANDIYAKASEFYNAGNYQAALENYLKITYKTPELTTVIANCYYETGNLQKAIDLYKEVLVQEPKNESVMLVLGNILLNSGQEEEGKNYLNKILAQNPNNKEAKQTLDAFNSGKEGTLLDEAISLYENKKYNDSLALLDKIISINSKNAYAYYYKGAVYEDMGNLDNALAEYKKSISSDPNFALGYYMAAVALDNKENYKEASNYYDKYVELKNKEGVNDEFTQYAKARTKELKDYLSQK